MKRFEFPLERVRQWRATEVDLEQDKLRQLFEQMHRLEAAAAALTSQKQQAERALHAAAAAGQLVDGRQLCDLDDFRHYVRKQQDLFARRRGELEQRIARQRQSLIDARRAFRLLEKLKQKAHEQWQHEYDRELENLASELHLAKLARTSADGARPRR